MKELSCLDCVYCTLLPNEYNKYNKHDKVVKCDYPMPVYILDGHLWASHGKGCAVIKTKLDLKDEK